MNDAAVLVRGIPLRPNESVFDPLMAYWAHHRTAPDRQSVVKNHQNRGPLLSLFF